MNAVSTIKTLNLLVAGLVEWHGMCGMAWCGMVWVWLVPGGLGSYAVELNARWAGILEWMDLVE